MKYVTKPNVEIIGVGMLSWFQNQQADEILPLIKPVMKQYGLETIDDIEPEKWYPASFSLEVFEALQSNANATSNLISIGMGIVEALPMPDDVTTLEDAMHALNEMYSTALRNFPEEEKYDIEHVSDSHIRLTDNSPYPHDLIYGYIYGLARRYAPNGNFNVNRTYKNPDDPNTDGAIYDVEW